MRIINWIKEGYMGAYENINNIQLDAMREIGNIGAGNACTALSVLMGTAIDMSVPSIRLVDKESAVEYFGGEDKVVLGLIVYITDDLSGMMVHVVQKEFAERIINTFYPKQIDDTMVLDEMDASVLNEMANITSGAYANSLASLTGFFVNIGTPSQKPGKLVDVMMLPIDEFVMPGEKLLIVDEVFTIDAEHLTSNMVLALDKQSMSKLFDKLGVSA